GAFVAEFFALEVHQHAAGLADDGFGAADVPPVAPARKVDVEVCASVRDMGDFAADGTVPVFLGNAECVADLVDGGIGVVARVYDGGVFDQDGGVDEEFF